MQIFYLQRNEDVSDVSGTGPVAVGVILPTGRIVLEWLPSTKTKVRSLGIYADMDEVLEVHGHGGLTEPVGLIEIAVPGEGEAPADPLFTAAAAPLSEDES